MSVFERDEDEERRPWWKSGRFLMTGGAIVVLLLATLIWRRCHQASGDQNAEVVVSVEVARAERGSIARQISMLATLVPQREAVLMPKVSAQIRQMGLILNRRVHAGDVLAQLESRDLAAQRAEAASAVTELESAAHETASGAVPLTNAQDIKALRDAEAARDNAERTLERRRVLYAKGGISKKDLEASELAATQAEDDLRNAQTAAHVHRSVTNPGDVTVATSKAQQARDRLAALDAQLGYTAIRAPFDGVVTEQFQREGDFAAPGTKMLTVADPSTLIAKMEVAEATAATLKLGDPVKIVPDERPNETYQGSVSLVGRGADAQSRSVEVWVTVPNREGKLRPNGSASVIIDAQANSNAVLVPASAITLDATNADAGTVMVVDAQSIAHEVHVTTGARSGGKCEILSGLQGGETVVTTGNYALPDGTKVALPNSSPKQPAASAKESD